MSIVFNVLFSSLDSILSKYTGFSYTGTGWREFSEILICRVGRAGQKRVVGTSSGSV